MPMTGCRQRTRGQLADHRHSGFDRGHMMPSGGMPGGAALEQSFLLSSMVPQTLQLNRGAWDQIEQAIRDLTTRDGGLHVVTEPAFRGASIQLIGEDGVMLPTRISKAVYDLRAAGTGVYVCRNTTAAPTCRIVPVVAPERVIGVDPFPAVPESLKVVAMGLPVSPGRVSLAAGSCSDA